MKLSTLLGEIRGLELRKVSMIVESRLVGIETPSREEVKAIEEFEARKRKEKLKLVPLEEIK